MWFEITLVLHLLAATVWTGGHLFIAIILLPKALKTGNTTDLFAFERNYERIGMPALLIQIITGFYLAYNHLPDVTKWLDWTDFTARHIGIKLCLLLVTLICAIIANRVLIPHIEKPGYFKFLSVLIYTVTVCAVLFVITGLSFRLGIF